MDFEAVTLVKLLECVEDYFDDASRPDLFIGSVIPGERTRLRNTAEFRNWLRCSSALQTVEAWVGQAGFTPVAARNRVERVEKRAAEIVEVDIDETVGHGRSAVDIDPEKATAFRAQWTPV